MRNPKTFTIGDLRLRDCWKLLKCSFQYLIVLGIIYGIGFAIFGGIFWGYKAGTKSVLGFEPIAGLWSVIPSWSKISIIAAIVFLVFRGLTSDILAGFGKMFVSYGEWIDKASFKSRALVVILITFWSIFVSAIASTIAR